MVQFTSTLKYAKSSAQKVRIPAKIVKGKNVVEALDILKFMNKSSALLVWKTVNSAAYNAVNNNNVDINTLYISDIRVDIAPKYKRMRPGSKGKGMPYSKLNCHITVVLENVKN